MAPTKSAHPAPTPAPALNAGEQGMNAQAGLLAYALLAFGISLPIFVWVASHARNAAWMSASFAVFAIGWANRLDQFEEKIA